MKLIRKSLYVDDLIGGLATVQEGHELSKERFRFSRMQHSRYISGTLMPQNWSSLHSTVQVKSHRKCLIRPVMSQLLPSNS